MIDTSMPFIYTRTGVTFESSKVQIKTRSPLASFALKARILNTELKKGLFTDDVFKLVRV